MRIDAGDENLKTHLEICRRNASYISWSTQNKIISACGAIILENLVKKVNDSKCFSILADTTSDISGIEQLSLCVRYMDMDKLASREDFLQFVPLTDMMEKGISDAILNTLHSFGIPTEYIFGQGYDGASAMRGQFKGVQAYIAKKIPRAIYVHGCSHSLNFAISDACTIPLIRNCIGTIGKVYDFFNTPKHQAELKKHTDQRAPKLKQLCPTRWIQRHDAVNVFSQLYESILLALHEIFSTWCNRDSASGAHLLYNSVFKCDFVISMQIICKLFSYSLPLAKYLQIENTDLKNAVEYAEDIIYDMRVEVEKKFNVIFMEAEKICSEVGILKTVPCVVQHQTQHSNIKDDNSENYYKISAFIPFIDTFLTEIKEKFVTHNGILNSFQALPTQEDSKLFLEKGEQSVCLLHEKYAADIDQVTADVVCGELRVRYKIFFRLANKPQNALEAISY